MSAIVRCKSKMKSKKFLLAALRKVKVQDEHLTEMGNDAVNINRAFHSGRASVSYSKIKDGTYTCRYDSDDTYLLNKKVEGKSFTGEVAQWYSALVVKDTLRKQGFMPSIKREGNKLRVYAQA